MSRLARPARRTARRFRAGGSTAGAPPPAAARKQRSLFGEILDWMLAPLLLLWPTSVVLTWLVAQGIANKPFDRELAATARVLSKEVTVEDDGRSRFLFSAAADDLLRADETRRVVYQVRGLRTEWLSGDVRLPLPRDDERAPPGEMRFRNDVLAGEPVRVAYLWVDTRRTAAGRAPAADPTTAAPLVQVAETLGARSQFATEVIKSVILPQFVILPLAVLLVWLALARGIAPLNRLQRRIRQRESSDLSPIDEREAPEEVSPLVRAINDLLARLDQSIRAQKHFLADAAHQLKTPLAGLRTQAELAERQLDAAPEAREALRSTLQQIAHGSQSAAHMVNQLLAMARAENREHAARREIVELSSLATEVVRDFVPRAMDKHIDLGLETPATLATAASGTPLRSTVHADKVLLRELIRNLVDNALQYTPAGGTVTMRVIGDPFGQVVVLQVEDSGPGIAAAERELVFQPFYRSLGTGVDGSGLGLAIVREIAIRHDASVTVEDASAGAPPGALFTVRLPAG